MRFRAFAYVLIWIPDFYDRARRQIDETAANRRRLTWIAIVQVDYQLDEMREKPNGPEPVTKHGIPAQDFASLLGAINHGDAYANVHTDSVLAGEIRGWLRQCQAAIRVL